MLSLVTWPLALLAYLPRKLLELVLPEDDIGSMTAAPAGYRAEDDLQESERAHRELHLVAHD